jgi:serine protease
MNASNVKASDTAGSSHFMRSPRGTLRSLVLPALLLALAGLLSSCPAPSGGEVSGSVSLGLSLTPSLIPAQDLIPGQFIVKFKPRVQSANLAVLNVNGSRLTRVRTLGTGATLYRASNVSSAAQGLKLAARLEARSDVEYAQPDRRLHAQSDPLLPEQWNLQARDALSNPGGSSAVNAWARLEGKSVQPVTVAVLDTGILWRSRDAGNSHPDLEGHVLPGFDFVSDPSSAGDGDGRDADAFDPGDEGGGRGSWHGSHVAGIITAVHNDLGVAGVADNARVQAVRVLGIGGGSLSDVLDGLLWAAGLPVGGAPTNATPAGIINLSLGGSGLCGAAERDAIGKVNAQPQSPVIVVAAGNDGVNVGGFTPSGCDGVLAIGASDRDGARPSYSNYGASLALLAPGGSRNNAGSYDNASAILSTIKTSSGVLGYGLDAGTSMSAPMVSGAIALMRGATPGLSRVEVTRILEKTAVPVSATTCRRGDALECGAGLLDVDAAVKAAIEGLPPEPPVQDYSLTVPTEATLIERGSSASLTLTVARVGGFDAPMSFAVNAAPSGLSVAFTPNPALDSVIVKLEASADSELGAFAVRFHSSAAGRRKDHRLNVNLVKTLPPSLIGSRIALFKLEGGAVSFKSKVAILETPSVYSAAFNFDNLEPGAYLLVGWRDANGNGVLEMGDSVGAYLTPEGSASFAPPISSADFDLETLDMELGARLESLGLPVGLEAELVKAVAVP